MTVGIADYGMGNLLSVFNAVEMCGGEAEICEDPERLLDADRIILPGVGAFGDCMRRLHEKAFIEVLNKIAFEQKKPVLGICLGMQAMAKKSYEFGEHEGLGWFNAEVVKIIPSDPKLKVPQIGWNDISYDKNNPMFKGLREAPDFYFVHSFYMKCENPGDVVATCEYGMSVTAAICKENIFATQFHPEKSQDYGLTVMENFLDWNP